MLKSRSTKAAKPARVEPAAEPTTLDEEMESLRSRAVLTSPQPKILVLLIIDVSGSMVASGARDRAIKAAEDMLTRAVEDVRMQTGAEVAVVAYDGRIWDLRRFGPLQPGEVWELEIDISEIGGGGTKTARAQNHAYELLERRREELSEEGVPVRATLVVVLTDGYANDHPDDTRAAIATRKGLEARGKFRSFGVAVGDQVDMAQIGELCGHPFVLAGGFPFSELWEWVYQGTLTASMTGAGKKIPLPDPYAEPDNETGFAKPVFEIGPTRT
jgi:uncharacterized protein YegL